MYGNKTLLRFYLGLDRTCMTRVMAPYSAKDDGFAFILFKLHLTTLTDLVF